MTTHHTHAQRFRQLPQTILTEIGQALLNRPLDPTAPYGDLVSAGWLAVDALLVLTRKPGNAYRDACALILGHSIAVGQPSALFGRPAPYPDLPPGPILRRVERNPRLPTTAAFQRYRHLRPGMSVDQALRRGVTRRDLREAVKAGWVEVG